MLSIKESFVSFANSSIGTLICPGLGTVIGVAIGGVIGGAIGSDWGIKLGDWVNEVTSD